MIQEIKVPRKCPIILGKILEGQQLWIQCDVESSIEIYSDEKGIVLYVHTKEFSVTQ